MTPPRLAERSPSPRPRLACACSLLVVWLASCSTGEGTKKSSYADMKWSQRVSQQLKDPFAIQTPFQKKVFNAARGVKTEQIKSGSFQGTKDYTGADASFKAGAFAQGQEQNRASTQVFSRADEQSRIGHQQFATEQSRFTSQANRDAAKKATMGDEVFSTELNAAAAKAGANAKRPLIQDPEKPSYSEQEVSSFLNKIR
ncbi:MAG: hypothetical protein ACOYMN_01785 [Roseimicrobium sp.]